MKRFKVYPSNITASTAPQLSGDEIVERIIKYDIWTRRAVFDFLADRLHSDESYTQAELADLMYFHMRDMVGEASMSWARECAAAVFEQRKTRYIDDEEDDEE